MDHSKTHSLGRFDYNESDFLGKGSYGKVYKGIDKNNG